MSTSTRYPSKVATDVHYARSAGSLTVSSIEFHCDLSRKDGLILPLGVMAEITVPGMRGLGLVSRTELDQDEIAALGEMSRRLIERPFHFLSQEFEDAWEHATPGGALQFLSAKHRHSLHFALPSNEQVPMTLTGGEVSPTARNAVRNYLGQLLEEQMLRLTGKRGPKRDLFSLDSAA